jgi:hypothetical protein
VEIKRIARCRCGQLTVLCTGEPVRVSVCHCHDCQKRSGSAFSVQARFKVGDVVISGKERMWETVAESGNVAVFHFCPVCGSTVWYQARPFSDLIAVPVGAFADSSFPSPHYSVYEERKHGWVEIVGDGVEHFD